MNSLDKMEDYDRLARLCEAKDAENKRIGKELERAVDRKIKARKQLSNAQTELDERARLLLESTQEGCRLTNELSEAHAQIAMLRTFVVHGFGCSKIRYSYDYECDCGVDEALSDTQSTALAYEREVKAKARIDTLQEAIGFACDYSDRYGNIYSSDYLSLLRGLIEQELRASKGE